MKKSRRLIPLVTAMICAAMLGLTAAAAKAQGSSVSASFAEASPEPIAINVLVGQSRVINFDRKIGRFSVSNPEVAEAVLVAPDQVLVNGKGFGQVNFIAWEKESSKFLVFDVFVRANLSLIDSQMRALFPKDDIRLSQANGSVVLSGSVKSPATATQAEMVVKAAGFQTVNMLASPVADKTQVQLQVRVAEVSRNKAKEIAPSYGLANGHSVGAIRSLAEPNLIAMDGQQASFLAGGEFPVPILQSSGDRTGVAIVWKEYGVRLNFKPTIIDEDHIRLEMEPEVSTIDFANGVKFEGFLIPALKTRRAKTGVELRDGQSFALAGLMDNNEIKSFSKVPGLGDIPILGHLFKSKSFTTNETELMFIVTVHMVRPLNRDELPQMKGIDGLRTGSPLGIEPKGEGIDGKTGFSTGATADDGKAAGEKSDAAKSQTNAADAGANNASATPPAQPAPAAAKETKSDAAKAEAPKTQATAAPAAPPLSRTASDAPAARLGLARVPPPDQK
ncbi:MAG: type II and III secretion system protein family protein [Acidobacteria bacterium]|nr:type II and III secretion system protein family protein [Acidobacteriota bacterium]